MKIETPNCIYIAGKISGLSEETYQTHFMAAERLLAERFPESKIYNPAQALCELAKKMNYDTLLEVCFQVIDCCDTIAFLTDWTESRGAVLEMEHALKLGLQVIELQEVESGYVFGEV